jgi:hypothetical protein
MGENGRGAGRYQGSDGIGRRLRWRAGIAALTLALAASTIGVLATPVQAAPTRPAAPATPDEAQPPAAGPGITASADGKVTATAPLPEEAPEVDPPTLVPGTVRVAPDRSAFRTIEPRSTPLDPSKAAGLAGPTPQMAPGVQRSADVNGDGHDDLVTAVGLTGSGYRAYISVMLGIGDGTYTDPIWSLAIPTSAPNGTTPYDMVVTDVDGDDNLDVIMSVTNFSSGLLALALGNGDGTFADPITSQAVPNPGYLKLGKWGGTADVQLAVTGASSTIHVVDVNPEGFDDLTPAGVGWKNNNWRVNAIEAADVDEDGQSELYIAMDNSYVDGEGIQRLTDLTSPTPSNTWVAGVNFGVLRMAFADIDGDSKLDLTVAERRSVGYGNEYRMRTVALPGRAPGADPFGDPVRLSVHDAYCPDRMDAGRMLPADMDHDGDLDLVTQNCQWGEVNYIRVALNDGAGAFTLSHWIATPGENGKDPVAGLNRNPKGITITDADGDDLPDVAWSGSDVTVANGVTVLLGNAGHPGELLAPPLLDAGARLSRDPSWNAQQVRIADWDEDGTQDLVVLRDDDIVWRKGDGSGRFDAPEVIVTRAASTFCPSGAGELGVFDLDDDGHLDLVCHTPGKTGMAWGGGEGVAVVPTPLINVPDYQNWNGYHGIDVADLDGDGDLDLVIPVFSSSFDVGSIGYVFFQGAARAWPSPVELDLGSSSTVAIGNVDDDPEPEVVAMPTQRRQGGSETTSTFLHVISWSANGSGGMTEHIGTGTINQGIGALPGTVDNGYGLGDFDGDGILDLVTIWYYGNPYYQQKLQVRKGLGDGEFASNADSYATSMNWAGGSYQRAGSSIGVHDMDGDGNLDLVYESTAYGVEILPGKGDGTFDDQRFGRWPAGSNNGTIEVGDVDGDHKLDVIAGNNTNTPDGPQLTHTLLLNRSVPNSDAQPDLAVTDVSAPTTVGAGDEVAVEVTVTNVGGDIRAASTWKDGAWLSKSPTYSLAATEIGVKQHTGPLAAGASYTVTLTGPARAFEQGGHSIIVRTDLAQQVTEPDETDNATTRGIVLTVPTLTPGGPAVHVQVATGASRLVRIPATAGRTVSITATPATANAVRARAGADRAPQVGAGTQLRSTGTGPLVGSLSRGTDGDLYAVVEGLSAAGSGTDVELVANDATVGLFTSSPGRVANGGDATLTITGAGLDGAAMQLQPRSAASGSAVDATRVRAGGTPGTWFATFPLDDQLGSFDLKASGPGGDALLPAAVVVEAPIVTPNAKEFEVGVSVPAQIRRHVMGPGGVEYRPGYTASVVVRNRTGRDLPAPFLRIEGSGLAVAWPDVAGGKRSVPVDGQPGDVNVLTLLGTVDGGPVDTIPARASVTLTFRIFATSVTDFTVDVGLWAASDQSGELDYSGEATALAASLGLPAAKAAAIETAMEQVTSHPTRPTYPGASPTGPWPTPGGLTRGLDRMAAALDAAGRPAEDVNEVRSNLMDSALAIADVGAPVSGRLTEPGDAEPGEPLDLLATPVDGSGAILGGTSAPDGRFNLFLPPGSTAADLSAESYELRVVDRLASPAATFTVDPSGSVTGLSVAIERGITATGRLTGPGGAGIRGAQVALTPIGIGDAAPVSAVSTVGGGWTAAGLKPGSYRLAVRAEGLATHVASVTVPASGLARFDAVLGAEDAVTGVVRAGGSPIAASVTARRTGTTEILSATTSAADGTYHLGGLADGAVTITAVAAAGSASPGASVAVDRTLSGAVTIDLALAATVDVTGTVVDGRSGDPVDGAHVVAQSDQPGVAPKVVTTGSDGSFTVADVPPTTVTVIASKDGRSSTALPIDAATHASGNQVRITDGHHITGTVRDANGDAVPGIEVQANGRHAADLGSGLSLDRVADGTTDDAGRFDLAVPAADTYDVTALDATVAATVADGTTDPDVDLVAHASIVRGAVTGSGGTPLANLTVHLLADGDEIATAQTGADGTYAFAPVGGRSYDVWVADSRIGLVHRTVAAPASGTVTAADLVPGPASVAVDLAGPSGAVAGTLALVPDLGGVDVPSPISLQVDVADSGHVVVSGLEAGTYHSMITSPGLVTARPDLAAAAPTPASVPVTLAQGGAVEVTVREGDGSPLASAEVDVVGTDPTGTGSAGVSGIGGTDADGKVVIEGLVAGTYDIWAIPTGRPTMLIATGVVVTAPAPAAPAAMAPTEAQGDAPATAPAKAETQATVPVSDPVPAPAPADPAPWKQVESTYATAEDGHWAVGQVDGANGTGFGATPPQVTLQTAAAPNYHVPVTIDGHGNFNLQHLPDGPLRMTVTRPGTQPRTFLFNIPGDLPILKLEVGLPLDANPDLGPDEPVPPLPGFWETFSSLFDLTEPEPLTQDPMMRTILAAQTRVKRCPSSDELLRQAKRNANLAAEQVLTYAEELEGRWNEWWNRAGLFTIQALNSAGTIVSAFVPLVQLYKGLKVGLTVIDDPQLVVGLVDMISELAASPVPGAIGELIESLSRDVTSGDFDSDQLLSVIKVSLDTLKFALEKQRDALLLVAKHNGGLVPQAAKVLRVVGQAAASFYGFVDGVNKAFEAYAELQNEYQAIKDFEDGADQARVQVRKLEQKALHLYALWLGQENGTVDCDQPKDLPRYGGGVGAAVDPNEISGPTGEGADRWLAVPAGLGYEVHFENLGPGTVNPPPGVPLATSPAAQVRLTETIPATYDRSSFVFDDLGWGTHVIDVPDGSQSFTVDEPITVEVDGDPVDLVVRVTGDYDPSTGKVSWDYRTLDPETGEIPLDPAKGFLPPEPGDETGQGWARYSVSGAPDVAQGTFLDAKVAIVFDTNDPIDTNTWRNRVGSPATPGGVCPTSDTADGRFLCALYPDVLGRTPDAPGKAYWLGRLDHGTSRSSVANHLLGSTEGGRTAVRQTFDQYLGRAPDPTGLAYWVGRMQDGATRDTVRQSVLASSEYLRSNGGTRAGFVDGLYDDVYGRSADGPGEAHWVAALAAGRSRSSVAGQFLFAPEGRRAIVRETYDDYLGRTLTFTEADYWAKRLSRTRNEQRFRAEVLGSNEYVANA